MLTPSPKMSSSVDDDVTEIDADAKFDTRFGRHTGIPLGHLPLHVDRAAHGVDDAGELDQKPVASGFDDAAAVFDDLRIDQFAPDRFQRRERAFLVGAHQPRIADHISGQDRRQPSLDPLWFPGCHVLLSVRMSRRRRAASRRTPTTRLYDTQMLIGNKALATLPTYNLEPGATRIFQIWILPTSPGKGPSWGAKPFPKGDRSGRFVTLASGDPSDGDALPIRTDARVLGATLKAGETAEYPLGKTRHGYLVPAKGSIEVNGVALNARDGAAIYEEPVVQVRALEDTELVLVDAA